MFPKMSGSEVVIVRRARSGLRSRALVALVPLVACAKVFGIDAGPVAGSGAHAAAQAGNAGRGGAGGRRAGGTSGGTPGAAAGTSGSSPGGEPSASGGEASASGGEASASGGEAGASPGSAGRAEAGAPGVGFATLGTACDEAGASACSAAGTNLVLSCDGSAWQWTIKCTDDERCDPAAPGCLGINDDCIETAFDGPVCKGNEVIDCSPDLYTERHLVCPFGCANGECVPGGGDQLTLHTGTREAQKGSWAGNIPVCLVPPMSDDEVTRPHFAWVKAEVERVWNRFLGVTFTGFGDCADGATGVVVSFPTDCEGHLVSDVSIGTDGSDVAIPLEICASYDDGQGHTPEVNEPLTCLLARHQFGHVLGLSDGDDRRDTVMLRGVELSEVDAIVPTVYDYDVLESQYFYVGKPDMALVTSDGSCVGVNALAAGSGLPVGACSSNNSQKWLLPATRLEPWVLPPEYCAEQASAGQPVTLSKCSLAGTPGDFQLPSVKWRTPTACVATESNDPAVGTGLVTSACTDATDPAQAWYFEVSSTLQPDGLGGDVLGFYARVHLVGTGLCVAVANMPKLGWGTLALDSCSTNQALTDPQLFILQRERPWSGSAQTLSTMTSGNKHIDWQLDGGNVYLGNLDTTSGWFLSGPLVNAAGLVLTLTQSDSDPPTAEPPTATPSPSQLFDFYF